MKSYPESLDWEFSACGIYVLTCLHWDTLEEYQVFNCNIIFQCTQNKMKMLKGDLEIWDLILGVK